MVKKRKLTEYQQLAEDKAAAEDKLRNRWKRYKNRGRAALNVVVRGYDKVKAPPLRQTPCRGWQYSKDCLIQSSPLLPTEQQQHPLLPLRVFKMADLQPDEKRIGDPCRQTDLEDVEEEQLSDTFLRMLYPQKYAQIDAVDALWGLKDVVAVTKPSLYKPITFSRYSECL